MGGAGHLHDAAIGRQAACRRPDPTRCARRRLSGRCEPSRSVERRCGPADHCSWRNTRGRDAVGGEKLVAGRSERIRTSDPLVPNEVRYQAALHSDRAPHDNAGGRLIDAASTGGKRDDHCCDDHCLSRPRVARKAGLAGSSAPHEGGGRPDRRHLSRLGRHEHVPRMPDLEPDRGQRVGLPLKLGGNNGQGCITLADRDTDPCDHRAVSPVPSLDQMSLDRLNPSS